MRVEANAWKILLLVLPLLFVVDLISAVAQDSTLVRIKTFNLNLSSISNLELSFDQQNYFNTGKDGSVIVELRTTSLPPKVIFFRDTKLEAESWNYSHGILEIIVREKTFETYQITLIDTASLLLGHVLLTLNTDSPIEGVSNNKGVAQLSIPVDLDLQTPDLFKIDGYNIIGTEFSDRTGKITALLIPLIVIADEMPIDEIIVPVVELDEDHLDSLQTLTAFYSFLRGLDMANLTDEQKELIDNKFSEVMVEFSDSLNQRNTISGRISDSTLVINDIIFLTEQAILERQSINKTREEFTKEIGLISEKVADGGGDLSDANREDLLNRLTRLDKLLLENEILFTQNQTFYKAAINDLKNSLLNIQDLEERLSDVEIQRLAEQKAFRKSLTIYLSITFGSLLLVILFIYLMRKVSKQKKELGIAHEEVKSINDNLELLVAKRTKSLLKVNNELDTFLYKSSHDLKRPLTTILGLANVAKITLNKEANELFEKTRQTANEMNKLLLKLLTISQINNPLEFSPINFKKIIDILNKEFKDIIKEKGINVTYNIDGNIKFHSHPKLIESILRNLLENAFLYSSFSKLRRSKVVVSISSKDENIHLRVYDNGSGISTDIKNKVWDMFYRGNTLSTGNGLGLYITKRAVSALKGTISFETKSGKYTTFNVQLPLDIKKVKMMQKPIKKQAELQPI